MIRPSCSSARSLQTLTSSYLGTPACAEQLTVNLHTVHNDMDFSFDGFLSPVESDWSYFDTYFEATTCTPATSVSHHSPKSSLGALSLPTSYAGEAGPVPGASSPVLMTSAAQASSLWSRSTRSMPGTDTISTIYDWLQRHDPAADPSLPMVSSFIFLLDLICDFFHHPVPKHGRWLGPLDPLQPQAPSSLQFQATTSCIILFCLPHNSYSLPPSHLARRQPKSLFAYPELPKRQDTTAALHPQNTTCCQSE